MSGTITWTVSWEYATDDGDSLIWHEGDTTVQTKDLRAAVSIGMRECLNDLPTDAVEVRGFSVGLDDDMLKAAGGYV